MSIELETERLLLRQWKQSDFETYAAYYENAETAHYVGGVMDRQKAWRHMASLAGHWALKGYGIWAVEEKASTKLVGAIGLWQPEGWPELEVGYWLVAEAQGKGYAKEAVLKAREFAYGELGAKTLVSYIDPSNEASKYVATSVGAKNDGIIELLQFGPHCVYRHPSPEDLASPK